MSRRIIACMLLLFLVGAAKAAEPGDGSFQSLFNGSDLSGWVLVNTAPSTWTVKDKMIICSGKPIGEMRTERMYQNFVLDLEWRHMIPKGNAGVFVWADDITARGVPFHRSIEVQVLENAYGNSRGHTTHGDIFPIHGATMTPVNGRGGKRAFPTEERSKPSPQWNHYRITCQDGSISLAVNGKVVTRGNDCSPKKGYICLESEGGIVHYRNLRIKELPETAVDVEDVAIANRNFRSIYSGLDLDGWMAAEDTLKHWNARDWILAYDGKADDAPELSTTETYGDIGFVFDVRLRENSGVPRFQLRGSERADIVVDPNAQPIGEHLQRIGQWNRFEGVIRGKSLTLSVNGREVYKEKQLGDVPQQGPLRIKPAGPAEFANFYVRQLSE